jgi:hypothetical protein
MIGGSGTSNSEYGNISFDCFVCAEHPIVSLIDAHAGNVPHASLAEARSPGNIGKGQTRHEKKIRFYFSTCQR